MSFTRKALYAPTPAPARGQALHIGGDPKGANMLYAAGRSIIIRNLAHPEIAKEYTGHSAQTTVARYAPSGFYIASADVLGNVRIWDTTQQENILKFETKAFAGRVADLDWDFESKRIVAVGEGKNKFGHAFLFDSGSSVGEISGHSKVINSVTVRPGRPLRAATASDDMTVNFYHGVPFKFDRSISGHSRFVQCVRYAPNGDFFASCGSDGKIFLYDGKSGDTVAELSAAAGSHTGGVYSLSWEGASTQLMTASADQTVKIWDVAARVPVTTVSFGSNSAGEAAATAGSNSAGDQQVGCLWQGAFVVSVSLFGDINYIDPRSNSGRAVRVVRGHAKAITALAAAHDSSGSPTLFSGSYDGRICAWTDGADGGTVVSGAGHSNQITAIAPAASGRVYSAALDDSVRAIATADRSFDPNTVFPVGAVPKGFAARGPLAIVASAKNEINVLVNGEKKSTTKIAFTPSTVTISPDSASVAIGTETGAVYIYALDSANNNLTERAKLEDNKGIITAMAYSPNGDTIAVADAQRNVLAYDTATNKIKFHQWVFHTARVNSVAWSPDGLHVVSASLDTNVEVWSTEKPMKHISIKAAHQDAATGAVFIDNNTIATSGQDAQIKIWSLTHF